MKSFKIGMMAWFVASGLVAHGGGNLIPDPSFEETRSPNQFGQVFSKWAGWKFDGECAFKVSGVAHSGKSSCLMAGYSSSKIRMFPDKIEVEPGRYRVTAWLRGLDIGTGPYRECTEFMFDGKYMSLDKSGDFGW